MKPFSTLAPAEIHRDLVDPIVVQNSEFGVTAYGDCTFLARRVPELYSQTQIL